ncbi:MAG: rod shape-determining protein MreC [Chitinophagales bacterium]|nr:rod shape-determining protein MreC [Chitinophagales bacterium]
MRNLIELIVRYHVVFIFVILELFSSFLIVNNHKYHQAGFLNAANSVAGVIYKNTNSVKKYLFLGKQNEQLLQENNVLRNRVKHSFIDHFVQRDSIVDTISPELEQIYTFTPATVIRNSTNNARNLIFLDKGERHGISKDMGVVGSKGVAGLVVNTGHNYSVAISVLHEDFRLSVKLKTNNYFGNLKWQYLSKDRAIMNDIPKHIDIEAGDTVVTSGFSSYFPQDIPVGVVSGFKVVEGTNFLEVGVDLIEDFGNLHHAYIVDFLHKNELEVLKESIE